MWPALSERLKTPGLAHRGNKNGTIHNSGPGNSVGIAAGYGLDGPGIEKRLRWSRGLHAALWYPRSRVRSRPKPSDFSSACSTIRYKRPLKVQYQNNEAQDTNKYKKKIPAGARFFAPVQTGPGAHPVSCTIGTGSFPGVESGRGLTLTPHPLLVPRSKK
jgi:hypothetical protein